MPDFNLVSKVSAMSFPYLFRSTRFSKAERERESEIPLSKYVSIELYDQITPRPNLIKDKNRFSLRIQRGSANLYYKSRKLGSGIRPGQQHTGAMCPVSLTYLHQNPREIGCDNWCICHLTLWYLVSQCWHLQVVQIISNSHLQLHFSIRTWVKELRKGKTV